MSAGLDRPPVPARVVTRRDRWVDAGIAASLLAGLAITIPLSAAPGAPVPPPWATAVWAVAITVPLAGRRTVPATCAVVVITALLAGQVIGVVEIMVSQIAPFVALYSVGAWATDRRRAFVVRLALAGAVLVGFVVIATTTTPAAVGAGPSAAVALSAASNVLYLAAAWAFGDTAWRSAMRRAALEQRTVELQVERERTARQAVAVERLRIARELHDVVAHRVSVIGVQAGAARRVMTTAPDRAVAALEAVEENSRRAIEELRSTVLALRDPDAPGAEPGPATSTLDLAQIDGLVADARAAGTPVDYTLTGDPAAVGATTALALYRVTQEALTNVRKHAGPGARARVTLVVGDGTAELVVVDAGGGSPRPSSPGAGVGELGMRERVAAAGGTWQAGPYRDGYRVQVVVPVGA